MRLTTLARPAAEGARLLALDLLDDAAAAARRLGDPGDVEALHDFRVAVRRLRSTLRAYRPHLDDRVTKKVRQRLRDIAQATNAGRDAEVQVAWLREREADLAGRAGAAARRLATVLDARWRAGRGKSTGDAQRDFEKIERRLRKHLSAPDGEARTTSTLAQAAAEALRRHAADLVAALAAAATPDDGDGPHRARIAAKRLRYLVEPLRDAVAVGPEVLERLRALQELLGRLQDARVLAEQIRLAVADEAAARAGRLFDRAVATAATGAVPKVRRDAHAGLLGLAARVGAERDDLLLVLERDWRGGGAAAVVEEIERAAAELSPPPGAAPAPLPAAGKATPAAGRRAPRARVRPRRERVG